MGDAHDISLAEWYNLHEKGAKTIVVIIIVAAVLAVMIGGS